MGKRHPAPVQSERHLISAADPYRLVLCTEVTKCPLEKVAPMRDAKGCLCQS